MKYFKVRLIIITALCISSLLVVHGQAYFKISPAADQLTQKVGEFSNGDLLIGNSSTAALRTGDESGVLILKRIDYCGNIIWTKEYKYNDGYLVLNDIAVSQDDDIYLYGRNNSVLTESIFIARITGNSLDQADLRIYDPGSVDNFTYSIDVNDNKLLIYGLLFDFNSAKEGFIGVFNGDLNFEKASKFTPFESTGNAIISSDKGIVGRSGPYIYKFDQDNELDWAFITTDQQDLQNIAGPFETDSGWIFESHNAGSSFLYKLNNDGSMAWKSELLEKTNVGGYVTTMSDDRLLFVYNRDLSNGTALTFYGLDGSGMPMFERTITHTYDMNTGELVQRINENDVNVIGSKNITAGEQIDIENFMLQFDIDDLDGECYSFDPVAYGRSNDVNITFEKLAVTPQEFELELLSAVKLKASEGVDDLSDLCSLGQEILPQVETKLLPCAESWEVSLPTAQFSWDDGYAEVDRLLSVPGIYSARNIDCQAQEILEYRLEKEECGCDIYLPNVIKPQDSDSNNQLELGIFCELESIDLTIFNRWGERVFVSNTANRTWQGKIDLDDAPAGVYSALLEYTWINANDEEQRRKIIQTVTLLR